MTFSSTLNPLLLAMLASSGMSCFVGAFQNQIQQIQQQAASNSKSFTCLHSISDSRRRHFLHKGAGAAISLIIGETILNQPADASYTAFTQREEDWNERSKKGDVKISSASSLRAQLRDIVPQNSEGSKIFCPNGESSAVSPLMENKCGDRQALPSVYGRADDVMGNSIPGFGGTGRTPGATAATLRAELGAQSYFRAN